MKKLIVSGTLLFLCIIGDSRLAVAQGISSDATKQLIEVAEFLCGEFQQKGRSESFELTGDAKVKLNGLLKKLTDIGIAGTGNFTTKEFEGLLQKDVLKDTDSVRKCRLRVWDDILKLVTQKTTSIKDKIIFQCSVLKKVATSANYKGPYNYEGRFPKPKKEETDRLLNQMNVAIKSNKIGEQVKRSAELFGDIYIDIENNFWRKTSSGKFVSGQQLTKNQRAIQIESFRKENFSINASAILNYTEGGMRMTGLPPNVDVKFSGVGYIGNGGRLINTMRMRITDANQLGLDLFMTFETHQCRQF